MIQILFFITCSICLSLTPLQLQINVDDGLSYFLAAETIALDSHSTKSNINLAKQVYVVSAVIDGALRDSVIVALLALEEDEELLQRLHGMRLLSDLPLVPSVLAVQASVRDTRHAESIEQLSNTLSAIRSGNKVTDDELLSLEPYRYLFPIRFNRLLVFAKQKRRSVSSEIIQTSLQLELAILGGATLWSADYAMTNGRPMALHRNEDLAQLYSIDTKKRNRKNGIWVE